MKTMEMEKIIKRYNKVMEDIGRENKTIGTRLSEGTDGWGLEEMIQAAKDLVAFYYEPWIVRDRAEYPLSEAYKLKRFIARFEPMIKGEE